jgi:Zn-dependent protease
MSFLGQATPSSVGAGWIRNTPSALRGHASAASGFPTPGNTFNGLIMGSNINPIISDYEYTVSGGSATITGYKGAGGAISIPSMLGGYPTIALGQYCFDSVLGHGITSAIIPNTVTTIGTQAFLSCSALTSVTIPQSVTRIESLAFSYCTSLSNATIPNGVAFFDTYTFSHDNALVSVVIGSGVTSIGDMALAYCPALTSITFLGLTAPTSVTSNWIEGNSAALRGHADAASNFPAAGASFYGLVMGGTIYQLPSAPLGLNGVAGNAQVVLSWLAPANEGSSPVTGYNLYRASAAGGPFALLAATASPGYTDVGLSNGQSYWYEVSALNSLGEGNLTPAMAAIPFTSPSVPTGLAASPGDGQITLRWTAPSDGGSAIDYYIVYQNGTELTVHPTGTSVTIQNLANGCNYSFAVAAHNAAGGGAQSLAVISSPAESGNEIGEVLSPAAAIIVGTGIAAIGVGLAGGSASASGSGVGDFADKMKGRFASLDKFFDFLYGFVKGRLTSMAFKLLNKVEPEKGVAVKREAFLAGFSAHEMVVIVFTSAVLGLTYLIANGMVVLDLGNILIYFVVAGFAIIVHDLTHRYMAWRYHAVSEYQFWWLGTAIMFLTAGLFHVVYAMPARLRIDASTKLTVRQEAFVYGSGPLVSFIVFLAFALLIPLGGLAETIALLGCSMNLLTAVYSMMPFKPMDGKFVMKWSIWAWVLTFPPLLALYFALTIYVF